MTARRIGRFSVARELVESESDVVRQLMGMVIIVRCELHYVDDVFEYTALSPHFAEVPYGHFIPAYTVIISEPDGIGLRTITFH
jgi:hypothetical protein